MKKCRNCQTDNDDSAILCKNCGAILYNPDETFTRINHLCILFGDVVGFTSLSETLDPEFITNILDVFFSKVREIISERGGFINRIIGDEFMAVFGFPVYNENSIVNAFDSAIEILKFLKEYNFNPVSNNTVKKIHIRMGLECGSVTIGMDRDNPYSLIVYGDTVFFASKLEKLSDVDGITVGRNAFDTLKNTHNFKPLEKEDITGYTYIENG
ncbi:hypothetical protein DRQ23_01815 [bacterium]|nr:MAG: hypothetical protein DRQ23_01815 [bacterium]